MKAKENEEKNKKLKQRMHAAEVRRKQEEEQQKKRLQQLEDERRMVTELANKRKELEVSLCLRSVHSINNGESYKDCLYM